MPAIEGNCTLHRCMFRLARMSLRRAFLAGGLAGLLPLAPRAQSAPRIRGLLAPLLPRHRVPGASVALIRDGEVADLAAIGADPQTLFQAASISKVVTAVVVLRLVEQGRIGFDRPVNEMLRSWSLPGAGAQSVTPRLLLSHRAGTTVPGFPGYAVGAKLPTLMQILGGTPPANTPAVRVAWPPGDAFRYSGGGTMVLQRLVQDVTDLPFDTLAQELVLTPAGLGRSSFAQPLPAADRDATSAHDLQGTTLPGRCHVYPEHAAAGLWSTPADLARLALAIAASWRAGGLLQQATAQTMATPIGGGPTGAGIFVQPRGTRSPYLYHYGVNAGFRSVLVFAADASFGAVLMTNGEGGRLLIPEFLGGLFDAYGQEPFRPAN
jgi:CubicO group peptidase (beta-lactamase class C family)